eukprot:4379486-Pleurochrysis_carterae.AAC.2
MGALRERGVGFSNVQTSHLLAVGAEIVAHRQKPQLHLKGVKDTTRKSGAQPKKLGAGASSKQATQGAECETQCEIKVICVNAFALQDRIRLPPRPRVHTKKRTRSGERDDI